MPSQPGMAVVFIIRDNKGSLDGVNILIGVEDKPIVSLEKNSFTRTEMTPGRYKFRMGFDVNKKFTSKTIDVTYVIKSNTVNIIRFYSESFKLAKDVQYGSKNLQNIVKEAYYQAPIHSMYTQLKQIPEDDIPKPVAEITDPSQQVITEKQKQIVAHFVVLQAKAECTLTNKDWVYTKGTCKHGLANGKGTAEDKQGLKFIGEFKNGQRIKGEIHQAGNMIFSGGLVNDKPDGDAICFFEGEYEECRFFKGKRIDTLYKMRKENAKMQAKMTQMQVSKQISSSQQKDVGDYAADALKREAADRAADYIFDRLF